jgi:GxxExxY protein
MTAAVENDPLTEKIIGLAIEIHRQLGPGLLESAYEECLCFELKQAGMVFERQLSVPVVYKSVRLDCAYRLDLVVEKRLIVEVKSVERLMPIHEAQLITYLRLTGVPVGLLLNFNTDVLKNGIRRLVHPHRLPASL